MAKKTKNRTLSRPQIAALEELLIDNEIRNADINLMLQGLQRIKDEPDAFKQLKMRQKWERQRKRQLSDSCFLALAQKIWENPNAENIMELRKQVRYAQAHFQGFCADGYVWTLRSIFIAFTTLKPLAITAAAVTVKAENPGSWEKCNADGSLDHFINRVMINSRSNRIPQN